MKDLLKSSSLNALIRKYTGITYFKSNKKAALKNLARVALSGSAGVMYLSVIGLSRTPIATEHIAISIWIFCVSLSIVIQCELIAIDTKLIAASLADTKRKVDELYEQK